MQYTTNLNLNKPDYTDVIDIQDLNDNFDVVDSTIKDINNNTTSIITDLTKKAPTSHASTATTYGVGTSSNYGHLKVADNLTTTTSGTALSANQGRVLDAKFDTFPIKSLSGKSVETGTYSTGSNIVKASTGATIIGNIQENRMDSSQGWLGNAATGRYALAASTNATATGDMSIALGYDSETSGRAAFAAGMSTTASGNCSTALGSWSTASGYGSFAVGCGRADNLDFTEANGRGAVAAGVGVIANGRNSTAMGYCNTALDYQFKIGQRAKEGTAGAEASTTGDAFIIGNGTSKYATSNAFRVTYAGGVYGLSAYNSSGADYAELFEWLDGNSDNEDRRGRFVTLDGEKIRFATSDDYILGVISATPCIVGDSSSEDWQGKYLTDVFGEKLTQTVHYDAEYEDREIIDPETGKKTIEKVLIHDEYDAVQWILNPDYDPEMEYIPREDRPEWSYVGTMGKLIVEDDGTCIVGKYCIPSDNGTGTHSETSGYRVMSRIDDTHIKVWVR